MAKNILFTIPYWSHSLLQSNIYANYRMFALSETNLDFAAATCVEFPENAAFNGGQILSAILSLRKNKIQSGFDVLSASQLIDDFLYTKISAKLSHGTGQYIEFDLIPQGCRLSMWSSHTISVLTTSELKVCLFYLIPKWQLEIRLIEVREQIARAGSPNRWRNDFLFFAIFILGDYSTMRYMVISYLWNHGQFLDTQWCIKKI